MAAPVPFTPLSQLRPKDFQAVICVRVIRKWNFTGKQENGPVLHVDLVLADEQGNVMYAEIPGSLVAEKSSLLETGKTYIIHRFKVRGAKSSYMPVAGNNMVEVTRNTQVELMENAPDTFPTYVQTIVPFDQIKQHIREHPDFIDVIGVVTKVDQPSARHFAGRSELTITRDIVIKDLSDKELRITLWGERSKTFDVSALYDSSMPRAIVALFVGCVPKEYRSVPYVTGNNACHWYLNPPIEEAQPFYDRFLNQHFPVDMPAPATVVPKERALPIVIEHKTVQELNDIQPYDFPGVGFHCTVSITDLPQDANWWYLGCRVCKKSSSDYVGGAPWCKICNISDFRPRYKLGFIATDATADAPFFCFDAIGYEIVKKSCEDVLKSHGGAPGTPAILASIVGNRYTFAIGLTAESYHTDGPKVYLINRVVEDFQRRVPAPRRFMQQGSSQTAAVKTTSLVPSISSIRNPVQISSDSALAMSSSSAASLTLLNPLQNLPGTPPSTEHLAATISSSQLPPGLTAHHDDSGDKSDKSQKHTRGGSVKRKLVTDSGNGEQKTEENPDLSNQTPARAQSVDSADRQQQKLPVNPQESSDSHKKRSKSEKAGSSTKTGGREPSSDHRKN